MAGLNVHNARFGLWLLSLLIVSATSLPVEAANAPHLAGESVLLTNEQHELLISLKCPRFVLDAGVAGGALPAAVKGGFSRGQRVEVSYPPQAVGTNGQLNVRLLLEWSAGEGVLHKWAVYQLQGAASPALLKEVVLDEVGLPGEKPQLEGSGVQSYPAFWRGFFAGIQFPVAATRVEGERVIVAHRPGWTLRNGEWHESRKAIFGVAPAGNERQQFGRYIAAHRPKPSGLHVNYNSWWTSPAPFYKENDILKLMDEFERKLFKPYGVSFDTFCIDMGWAEPRSAWEIKKDLFPEGFARIQRSAVNMGASLGLWISPSACYHDALNPDWARTNLETFLPSSGAGPGAQMCCLGGNRYATAFRTRLVDLVRRYGIRHVKLDGSDLRRQTQSHAPEFG
jgi:hypothetical protein